MADKVAEKAAKKAPEKVVSKVAKKPSEKAVKGAAKQETVVEGIIDTTVVANVIGADVADTPIVQVEDVSVKAGGTKGTAEAIVASIIEDKQVDKTVDNPADKVSDNPADKATSKAVDRVVEPSFKRVPVCLKFDTSEGFFTDFVEPLRDSRELSSFIIRLLRCYYETDTVRSGVDETLADEKPFELINQGLERIINAHNESVMMTGSIAGAVSQGKAVMQGVAEDFVEEFGEQYEAEAKQRAEEYQKLMGGQAALPYGDGAGVPSGAFVNNPLEQRIIMLEKRLGKVDSIDTQLHKIMQAMGITEASVSDEVIDTNTAVEVVADVVAVNTDVVDVSSADVSVEVLSPDKQGVDEVVDETGVAETNVAETSAADTNVAETNVEELPIVSDAEDMTSLGLDDFADVVEQVSEGSSAEEGVVLTGVFDETEIDLDDEDSDSADIAEGIDEVMSGAGLDLSPPPPLVRKKVAVPQQGVVEEKVTERFKKLGGSFDF